MAHPDLRLALIFASTAHFYRAGHGLSCPAPTRANSAVGVVGQCVNADFAFRWINEKL